MRLVPSFLLLVSDGTKWWVTLHIWSFGMNRTVPKPPLFLISHWHLLPELILPGDNPPVGEAGKQSHNRSIQSSFDANNFFLLPWLLFPFRLSMTLWSKTAKNTDCSAGPLARPFARSLEPLTHSLAPDYSLRSRPPLRSLVCLLARGKVND